MLASEALSQLCDNLGYRIVLGLDNEVRIERLGQGSTLPNTPDISSGGVTVNPPDVPDRITIIGSEPDQFEWDFELEAVGLDVGDVLVPIDKLSYAPEAGWTKTDITNDFNFLEEPRNRERAKKSVFRM